jgi:hypothetical protein
VTARNRLSSVLAPKRPPIQEGPPMTTRGTYQDPQPEERRHSQHSAQSTTTEPRHPPGNPPSHKCTPGWVRLLLLIRRCECAEGPFRHSPLARQASVSVAAEPTPGLQTERLSRARSGSPRTQAPVIRPTRTHSAPRRRHWALAEKGDEIAVIARIPWKEWNLRGSAPGRPVARPACLRGFGGG